MQSFSRIYAAAAQAKGGADKLENLLPLPKSDTELAALSNDCCLAEMTRAVFRAGFIWQVVDNKWAGFEVAFHRFDPQACAALTDAELRDLRDNEAIVRNYPKILAVRDNARFVLDIASEHGSFGRFLVNWAHDDAIGLWQTMRKRGSRLGGLTGPLFLAAVGRDTFVPGADVVKALGRQGIVSRVPTTRAELEAVQAAFNHWHVESGRPFCQLSRVLAWSAS